jgi:hypothetical protein
MPLQFKAPGYIGNALLLILSVIIFASDNGIVGVLLARWRSSTCSSSTSSTGFQARKSGSPVSSR